MGKGKVKGAVSFVGITLDDLIKQFPKDAVVLVSRLQLQKQVGKNLSVGNIAFPSPIKIEVVQPPKLVEAQLTEFENIQDE